MKTAKQKVKLSSQHLYHFTPKLEYLISILKNGFVHREVKEDLPLTGYKGSVFSFPGIVRHDYSWEVVCFCDIPENAIHGHSDQYGGYGVSLKKSWGMEKGVTPIRYIHYFTPDMNSDTFYEIKDTLGALGEFEGQFTRFVARVLQDHGKIEGITEADWESLPEKFRKVIDQVDRELPKMFFHTLRYLGLARRYQGEWTDRVTEKKTVRIFYDEKEWRSLRYRRDQRNLTFTPADLINVIVRDRGEKDLIRASLKGAVSLASYSQISRKIVTLDELQKRDSKLRKNKKRSQPR